MYEAYQTDCDFHRLIFNCYARIRCTFVEAPEIRDELSIKNNNFNDTNETASENRNLHVCLTNQGEEAWRTAFKTFL